MTVVNELGSNDRVRIIQSYTSCLAPPSPPRSHYFSKVPFSFSHNNSYFTFTKLYYVELFLEKLTLLNNQQ